MQTKFEHFAATSMMGADDSPPRDNGTLRFERDWEGRAFGMAIALSKEGNYEWEDFRQGLMASIAQWETSHELNDASWDYYQRWLHALEKLLNSSGLVDSNELEARTEAVLEGLKTCVTKATCGT